VRRKWVLITVMVVLALVAVAGWLEVMHGLSARDNPTVLEEFVAVNMRKMAMPSEAKNQKNPYVATPELMTETRRHFADHCATCHGNDGTGNTSIGRNLYPKAPNMRLADTQTLTDGELYYIIHNGIRLTGMPAWGEANEKDEDSWKLVLFIRHLPKLTPEEEKDMEQSNPKSTMEHDEEVQEEKFLKGGSPPAMNKHQH
jgi:mono/diheme cytochrome c family protein